MKKRKLNVKRLLLLIFIFILIMGLGLFAIYRLIGSYISKDLEEYHFSVNDLHVNELDYSDVKNLPLELNSKEYLLIRLNDFKVLYGKDYKLPIYPASLTKVLTLNTIVNNIDDLNETSSISYDDYNELINANASLAYIGINKEYSIKELLYGLVLPSGADASRACANYLNARGIDLVDAMNKRCKELGLSSSHFTNDSGLHDNDLYTTLSDYATIVIDTLLNKNAKAVLKCFSYESESGVVYRSTLRSLSQRNDDVTIYGGKTGFTGEAGENIMVLYSVDGRSYLLLLANADGNPYIKGQDYHIQDVNHILEYLYGGSN